MLRWLNKLTSFKFLVGDLLLGKFHVLLIVLLLYLGIIQAFLVIRIATRLASLGVVGPAADWTMSIVEDYLILLSILTSVFASCLGGYTFRGCLGLAGCSFLAFKVVIITELELWAHINSFRFSTIPHVLQTKAHETDGLYRPSLIK